MAEKHPASLQRIAQRAGVHRATVSRALRNDPQLPTETRERIQAVAHAMGYRPNPMVATLMAQVRASKPVKQSSTLAFITAFPTRDGWRKMSYMFQGYFAGASERANQLGYGIEEIWGKEPGMTGRRLSDILRARGIRGVLIAPLPVSRGHLSLDWSRFAAATFGPSLYKPDLARATTDHFDSFMLALRRLTKLGYRRIGLVTTHIGDQRSNHAETAALSYHQRTLAFPDRVPPLLKAGLTEPQCRKWFEKHRPDMVVGMPRLLHWFANWGLRVPRDVGYADPMWAEGQPWAGIDPKPKLIGAAAVDLVVGQLHRNETGIPDYLKLVVIPGRWVDGPTVRKRK